MKCKNEPVLNAYLLYVSDQICDIFSAVFKTHCKANVIPAENASKWLGVIKRMPGFESYQKFESFPVSAVLLKFTGECSPANIDPVRTAIEQFIKTSRCRSLPYNLQIADSFPEMIDGNICFEFFVLTDSDFDRTLSCMMNPAMNRVAESDLAHALTQLQVQNTEQLEAIHS